MGQIQTCEDADNMGFSCSLNTEQCGTAGKKIGRKQIQASQLLTWIVMPSAARVKSSAAVIVHLNVPFSFGRAKTSRGPFKSRVLNPGKMGISTLMGLTAAMVDVFSTNPTL